MLQNTILKNSRIWFWKLVEKAFPKLGVLWMGLKMLLRHFHVYSSGDHKNGGWKNIQPKFKYLKDCPKNIRVFEIQNSYKNPTNPSPCKKNCNGNFFKNERP